jgi:hypothetical protein
MLLNFHKKILVVNVNNNLNLLNNILNKEHVDLFLIDYNHNQVHLEHNFDQNIHLKFIFKIKIKNKIFLPAALLT